MEPIDPRSRPWARRRELRDTLRAYREVFAETLEQMHGPHAEGTLDLIIRWRMDTRRFEAEADLVPPEDIRRRVSINVACYTTLQLLANRVFSSPAAMRRIGDPTREARRGLFDRGGDAPRCPARAEASFIVAELGVVLIFLHEVAHHALGHIPPTTNTSTPAPTRRTEAALAGGDRPGPQQALRARSEELEADAFALAYIAALGLDGRPPFATQLVRQPGLRELFFEMAVLAHALVVCSFADIAKPIDAFDRSSHPHPIVRLVAAQTTLIQLDAPPDRLRHALSDAVRVFVGLVRQRAVRRRLHDNSRSVRRRIEQLNQELHRRPPESVIRFNFDTGRWAAGSSPSLTRADA
jgi:hypothetical protein